MDPNFESMSLSNVAEGVLEDQFQDHLDEVAEIFENGDRYEHNKDGVLTVRIVQEIEISRQRESSTLGISVRGHVKRPKHQRIDRTAFYGAGEFTTPRFKTADLFPKKERARPTPLRPTADQQED